MKKAICVSFVILLIFLSFASCGIGKLTIEDHEWKMAAVMINDMELADSDSIVIAVGEPDEVHPNAPVVDIILTAKDGQLTVTDMTNDKVYKGTYKVTQITPRGTDYKIELDGQSGYATVAPTKYYGGEEVPTLPINLGGRSLYFIPND